MLHRRCVVSTVGTSLLTNLATTDAERALLRDSANQRDDELSAQVSTFLETLAERLDQLLATAEVSRLRRASAELNGLYGLYGGSIPSGSQDIHFLLGTDTAQGRCTAEALSRHLRARGLVTEVYVAPGLSTRSTAAFTEGITAVIRWCEETLEGYRQAGYRIVFNLVGSF
jgi:CRISPR/Cas system-associated protein Csm6